MPIPRPPRFLQAFYDSLSNDDHGWLANCPICTCEGMTIRPDKQLGVWWFGCPDGCAHQEVVAWLLCDVRLYGEEVDEEARRGWMCMMLAPTLDLYRALLRGDPVAEHRLDPAWLARFRSAGIRL